MIRSVGEMPMAVVGNGCVRLEEGGMRPQESRAAGPGDWCPPRGRVNAQPGRRWGGGR